MNEDELNQYYSIGKNRFGLLQHLANYSGDFRIIKNSYINNQPIFHKWSSVLEESSVAKSDYVDKCTHRQILPYEVILDMDDPAKVNSTKKLVQKWIADDILDEIYVFETGSKGIHIHIFLLDDFKKYPPKIFAQMMTEFENVMSAIGFDVLKSSRKVAIALEFAPHWKSGKQKKLLLKRGEFYEKFKISC